MKRKIVFCFLVLLLVSSCATSKPTNFYSITSLDNDSAIIKDGRKLIIGIDFVSVPGYLGRPQIVTIKNDSDTELNLSEFDRWAEPIANTLQRVIASNMSKYMDSAIVRPSGVNRRAFDYVVSIEINRFDGKFGDKAVLDVWWTISGKNNKVLANEHSFYEKPAGENYDELVMSQSELISKFSTDIAKRISKL